MVIKISSKEKFSFKTTLKRNHFCDKTSSINNNTIIIKGSTGGNGVRFCTALGVAYASGKISTMGEYILCNDIDNVILLLTAATTFRHENPENYCLNNINQTTKMGYDKILSTHLKDYQSLFARVKFELGNVAATNFSEIPDDQRLENIQNGVTDLNFIEKYFQFADTFNIIKQTIQPSG